MSVEAVSKPNPDCCRWRRDIDRWSSMPKAFDHTAQGRESASAPWGNGVRRTPTLKGSHHRPPQTFMKPFQGMEFIKSLPRVRSRTRDPGLCDATPSA